MILRYITLFAISVLAVTLDDAKALEDKLERKGTPIEVITGRQQHDITSGKDSNRFFDTGGTQLAQWLTENPMPMNRPPIRDGAFVDGSVGDGSSQSSLFVKSNVCGVEHKLCFIVDHCYDHKIGCARNGTTTVEECKPILPFCAPCFPFSRCGIPTEPLHPYANTMVPESSPATTPPDAIVAITAASDNVGDIQSSKTRSWRQIPTDRMSKRELENCSRALYAADENKDDKVDLNEFEAYARSMGLPDSSQELNLPLVSTFTFLACLCTQNPGSDPQCCVDNPHIDISGTQPGAIPTPKQSIYLYQVCSATETTITRVVESATPTSEPSQPAAVTRPPTQPPFAFVPDEPPTPSPFADSTPSSKPTNCPSIFLEEEDKSIVEVDRNGKESGCPDDSAEFVECGTLKGDCQHLDDCYDHTQKCGATANTDCSRLLQFCQPCFPNSKCVAKSPVLVFGENCNRTENFNCYIAKDCFDHDQEENCAEDGSQSKICQTAYACKPCFPYSYCGVRPTVDPTASPTARPTARPTVRPTASPTARPTASPTVSPTARPIGDGESAPPSPKPTEEDDWNTELLGWLGLLLPLIIGYLYEIDVIPNPRKKVTAAFAMYNNEQDSEIKRKIDNRCRVESSGEDTVKNWTLKAINKWLKNFHDARLNAIIDNEYEQFHNLADHDPIKTDDACKSFFEKQADELKKMTIQDKNKWHSGLTIAKGGVN